MSFHGRLTEPEPTAPLKTFSYLGLSELEYETVQAHDVFFYESGHVGFWNNLPNEQRTLVLAVQTKVVKEVQPETTP
jgi:hypothetical protein